MRAQRLIVGAVWLFFVPGAALPQDAADEATARQKLQEALRLQKDRSDLPILDVELAPTDDSPVRKERSRYFSDSGSPPLPSLVPLGVSDVYMPRFNERPGAPMDALPVDESDAVVRGVVTGARAFLTEDRSAVYSEFSVRVHSIFKADPAVAIGGDLTALRWGGALQLPDAVVRLRDADQIMPELHETYVLFLRHYSGGDPAFVIVGGYQLDGRVATALDIRAGTMRFEGASEAALVSALKTRLR